MKRKDLTALVVVAVISVALSLLLSGMFFSTPQDRAQKVEVVSPVTTTFESPDSRFFNSNSVNPAQNINVGTEQSGNPFNQ